MFKSFLKSSIFLVLSATAVAKVPVLPMKRIIKEAEEHKALLGPDPANKGDQPFRELRLYKMTSQGIRPVTPEQMGADPSSKSDPANEPPDEQTNIDVNDGSDQTAYDDAGFPLTPAHLAEFRLCKDSRLEEGANQLNAYWMSVLSSIAYLKFPIAYQQLRLMGFDEVYFVDGASDVEVFIALKFPKRDTAGKILPETGLSVVGFRGTDGVEDWLTNLQATTHDISGHNGEAWLHEGFALDLNEVYPSILEALDLAHNPSPIFLTGHSLGGALAMQLGIRLVASESETTAPLIGEHDARLRGIYTYAIPRPGNLNARIILDHYLNTTRNFAVHFHVDVDPVSKVPFHWWGYRRFGLQVVLPYKVNNASQYSDEWQCHADATYPGPSFLSSELWTQHSDAHYMTSYVKYFVQYRLSGAINSPTACNDAMTKWGVRFVDESNETYTYKGLQLARSLGLRECEYSSFHVNGAIQ